VSWLFVRQDGRAGGSKTSVAKIEERIVAAARPSVYAEVDDWRRHPRPAMCNGTVSSTRWQGRVRPWLWWSRLRLATASQCASTVVARGPLPLLVAAL
jgi:hypothetical protein